MKMNKPKLSKTNTVITRPILNLLIFLIFISTCSKNPTESTANNNTPQGFSIYHEISIGEQILNNIIVKADTITAFVTYEGLPAIEKYVAFNKLYNAQGQLTPATTMTDSMGVAKSIYKLVYIDELLSDTIINVQIDIGAGNNANSISAHDTVNLVYELKAVDPLSAIEYFNFSPNNANLVNLASEDLEVSVIARNDAGVGVCNIPVRFQLIGDEGSIPNGSINSAVGYTCESSTSDDDEEESNTFGKASVKYTNDGGGIDYLIAKILDPANDTLYLFADTIRIETVGSTQLINDVVSISSNMSQSIINIDNADSTKTDTIFTRAIDANGAIISGIPFQFTLSNNYLGAVYLSDGGSISDDLGIANSVVNINASLFSELNGTISFSSLSLIVNITIPSTVLNSSLEINVLNNLPIWNFDSDSLIYTTINKFNFEPNNESLVSLPDVLEIISVIVKDGSDVGLCGIPVHYRLEGSTAGADVLGVISESYSSSCDSDIIIPGIATVNYYNVTNGIDILIAEIQDPNDNSVILYSDTLKIETIGSTQFVNDVASISANVDQTSLDMIDPNSIITDTIFTRALDASGAMIPEIPFSYELTDNYNGTVYLSSSAAISDSLGTAYSIINVHPFLFSELNNTHTDPSISLNVNITIPATDLNTNLEINVQNNLPIWNFDSDSLIYTTINRFNFEPNNENIVSLPEVEEEISVIVKDGFEVGLCDIPVYFRLEANTEGSNVLGVISESFTITCEDSLSINGIATIKYNNVTNGIDILIAEIQDPNDNTLILYSDTLKIETIGSTQFVNDVISMYAGLGWENPNDDDNLLDEEYFKIFISDSIAIQIDTLFAKSVDINGALIPEIPYQFIISEADHYDGTIYLEDQGAIADLTGFAYTRLSIHPSLFIEVEPNTETIDLPIAVSIPSTDFIINLVIEVINHLGPEYSESYQDSTSATDILVQVLQAVSSLKFYPDNPELVTLPADQEGISVIVQDELGAGLCEIPVTFRLEEISPNPDIFGVISASSATTCDTTNNESGINGVAQIQYNNSSEGSDLLIVEIADPEDESIILFSDSLLINTVGSTSLIEIVTEIFANASQAYLSVFNPDSIITDTIFARALDVNGGVVPEIPFQFTINNITVGVVPLELSEINGTIFLSAGASISDSIGIAYSIINIHPSLFTYLENEGGFDPIESVQLNVSIAIPSSSVSASNVEINILNDLPYWYPSSAELTLTSSSYILPCESCEDSTSAIITATVLDSLNNPPPLGTVIEFSSLQKDTTGMSGEGFEWVRIGNIAPAATLDPDGIATVNFYMQNDRGVAYIIGSIYPFNVSDTIQIIIESTDANHIEILPPGLDEIVVQGGGGIEYSEVFVQITDDAGNIIYDKPYMVQFELAGAPSGATLENGVNEIAKDTDSGETSVTIVSGTEPGAVNLLVELFNVGDDVDSDTPIATAVTTPLTIVTGAPEYGEINFSVIDMAPIVGGGIYEYPLSVYLEDVHSNPVADSTSVYFKIRENADPWDILSDYNYNDKVAWFDGEATVLDSVVYTCIDNVNNCSAGTTPDTDGSWLPSAHPAEIVGHGETGMASPFDGDSYPGVAFSRILFGSNSIAAEVIVFVQTYSASNVVCLGYDNEVDCENEGCDWNGEYCYTEFIIDSRTNHSGNGIVFPCYECSISLTALPTQWDFSQPPFDVNADTDFQDVMVSATVTDYFQFPVFNAEIVLDAPQADFIFVCGGEDTDLDGTTGDCTLVADGTTTLPLVQDCWTCIENYAPDYAWIVEDSDGNDAADTDGTLMLTPDDIPNYARTSSTGVAAWTIRYSEGVNIPQGADPVTYQTFNTTITVSLITPSTNNPSETVTIIISKSEED